MRRKQLFTVSLIFMYLATAKVEGSYPAVSFYPGFANTIQTVESHLAPYRTTSRNDNVYHPKSELRHRLQKKPILPRRRKSPYKTLIQNKATCDGRANLISDIGLFSIITGAIDALLSLYSTGFTSIVSNVVSIVNVFFSFAFGIPSAIITYLAASDRVSYTVANVLSMLSFANTFYGIWSVDKGNLDILTSTVANAIGLTSVLFSIATAYPSLIDDTIDLIGDATGSRREINKFVNNYGCSKKDPTFKVLMNRLFDEIM